MEKQIKTTGEDKFADSLILAGAEEGTRDPSHVSARVSKPIKVEGLKEIPTSVRVPDTITEHSRS